MRRGRLSIAAVLIAAGALRALGIGFGLPYPYAAVDEHIVTDRAVLMTSGDLNPHYFAYPSLSFDLHALLALAVHAVGRIGGAWRSLAGFATSYWLDPTPFLLAARWLTLAIAVASVWATSRLASGLARARLTDGGDHGDENSNADGRSRRRAAVVGAAALALSFLHVSNSRWVTVDAPVVLFAALTLCHALRHLRAGGRRDLLLAALFAGLAASSKYYGALLALPVAAAGLLSAWRDEGPGSAAGRAARRLLAAAGVTIAAFLATSPFVVLDFAAFRSEFAQLGKHMAGGHLGHDPTRSGAVVYASLLASRQVGAWLLIPAAFGLIALLARRTSGATALVLLLQPVAHFVLIARFRSQPADYLLVLLPTLAALAGYGAAAVARAVESRSARRRATIGADGGAAAGALACAVVALPLSIGGWHAALQGLALRRPDTRVVMRRFIEEHLPDGTRVAADTWLDLPLTADCLERMTVGDAEPDPVKRRRSRDEPAASLEAKLAAARAQPRSPAYDFALLAPAEVALGDDLIAALKENGFRWLVLDGTRAVRMERTGGRFQERAAWYRRWMEGPWIAARFDPAYGKVSGPPLTLIDVDRTP